MSPTVAIIEDNPLLACDLEWICQDAGWTVLAVANSLNEVRQKLNEVPIDAVISDMQLIGPEDGVDVVTWLKKRNPGLHVVFVTGTEDPALLTRIDAVKPQEVFAKPVDPTRLTKTLNVFRS